MSEPDFIRLLIFTEYRKKTRKTVKRFSTFVPRTVVVPVASVEAFKALNTYNLVGFRAQKKFNLTKV